MKACRVCLHGLDVSGLEHLVTCSTVTFYVTLIDLWLNSLCLFLDAEYLILFGLILGLHHCVSLVYITLTSCNCACFALPLRPGYGGPLSLPHEKLRVTIKPQMLPFTNVCP